MARRRIVDNVADPDILQIADHLKIAADYPVIQVFLPFNHGKLHFRRSVDRLAVADDVDEIYRDILDPGIEAHRNPSALFKPAAVDDLAGKAVIAVIDRKSVV